MAHSQAPALHATPTVVPSRHGQRAATRPLQRSHAWCLIDRCCGVLSLVVVALAAGLPLASEFLPSGPQAALPEWWPTPAPT